MKATKDLLNEKGFTFIELMITVALAGLAIVAILGSNLVIRQGSEFAYERTLAMQDAQQVIEQMRNAAKDAEADFQAGVLAAGAAAVDAVGSLPPASGQEITVTNNGAADDDPLDITVTVAWNERGQRAVTTSLRTLITRRITS